MNRNATFTAVAVWVMVSSVSVPAERPGNDLSFLLGDWVGGGSGQRGQGAGSFSFEGHVIHYEVTTDLRTKTATFLSVDPPPSPLFRLTYQQTSPDNLRILFEISPTGKAEDFKSYLAGAAIRKKPQRP